MNEVAKITISLTMLALFGFALPCNADAGSPRARHDTGEQIEACISEIGRHADYGDASRVVHWVARLNQKNLVETEIRIETSVYLNSEAPVREYAASCVTGTMGDLVKFRFNEVGSVPGKEA